MPPRKAIIQLDDGWAKLQGSIDQLIEVCENDFPPKTDMSQAMANYSCALPLLPRLRTVCGGRTAGRARPLRRTGGPPDAGAASC